MTPNDLNHDEKLALGYLARAGSFRFTEIPTCYVRGGHGLVRKGLAEKQENEFHKRHPKDFGKWEFRATDEGAHLGFHCN